MEWEHLPTNGIQILIIQLLEEPISGATNSTYNPPTNTVGEIFYYVVISFDGGCADIESDVASVNGRS